MPTISASCCCKTDLSSISSLQPNTSGACKPMLEPCLLHRAASTLYARAASLPALWTCFLCTFFWTYMEILSRGSSVHPYPGCCYSVDVPVTAVLWCFWPVGLWGCSVTLNAAGTPAVLLLFVRCSSSNIGPQLVMDLPSAAACEHPCVLEYTWQHVIVPRSCLDSHYAPGPYAPGTCSKQGRSGL